MICKRCKRLSDDDLEYCPYCGKSFYDDSERPVDNVEKESEYFNEGVTGHNSGSNGTSDTPENDKIPINIFGGSNDRREYGFQYQPRPTNRPSIARSVFSAALYFFFYLFINILVTAVFLSSAMIDSMYDIAEEYYKKNSDVYGEWNEETFAKIYSEHYIEITTEAYKDALSSIDLSLITIIYSAATLIALIIIFAIRRKRFHAEIGLRRIKNEAILLVLPFGVSLQFLIVFLLNLIPLPEKIIEDYNRLYSLLGNSPRILEIIGTVIAAPIIEEVVFRGLVYTRLRRAMSAPIAAGLCAAIFALAHGHIIATMYAFIIGLILCFLMERFRSLWAPILLHIGFNTANYLPFLREDSSTVEIMITVAISFVIFAASAFFILRSRNSENKVKNSINGGDGSDNTTI
jgi:membrane protease YdiL (CAAX protease family)